MVELFSLNPSKYTFDPKRRLLLKAAATTALLSVAGITTHNITEYAPSVFAQVACPSLPTDGNPAECTTVGDQKLEAASKFSGYYFIDNGNGFYDEGDEDIMGVPNRRILVESLQPLGSSDYLQPNFQNPATRIMVNGRINYLDAKSNILRPVQNATVLTVPADGGIGLALDPSGRDTLRWHLSPGNTVDKIWGRIHPQARASKTNNLCGVDSECGWNCVQWVIISRLNSTADIHNRNLTQLPNEYIHQFNGKVSSYVDFIHFWDTKNEKVIVDHSYINSPIIKDSELWKKENLTKKYVERPIFIRAYT